MLLLFGLVDLWSCPSSCLLLCDNRTYAFHHCCPDAVARTGMALMRDHCQWCLMQRWSLAVAYTPLESLTDTQKQALAFDLGLAALCGEKIYQFGELLLHPILNVLEGTEGAWLVQMLKAFNTGDIKDFEAVSKSNENEIKAQAALVANQQRLREKVRICR